MTEPRFFDPKSIARRAVSSARASSFKTDFFSRTQSPLVIQPTVSGISANAWSRNNREFIQEQVLKHGAILFRNFFVTSAEKLEGFVKGISGELLEYSERSSPRTQVGSRIYTSTDYPASQAIFPHNEHSYAKTFPLRLYFCCITPAVSGGETPIADCRRVLTRLTSRTKSKFSSHGWLYVRNFGDGFGLSWQTAFQTEDKSVVEAYCRAAGIQVEWKLGKRLRTRQVRPAIAKHPRTGEEVWFNHATFFHISTLEPIMRNALMDQFQEEDLPNNTYYGDGSGIEPDVLDELRAAYLAETSAFTWEQGDVLLIDNMLTAHSRAPFTGPRTVLVAMAEPFTRHDLISD